MKLVIIASVIVVVDADKAINVTRLGDFWKVLKTNVNTKVLSTNLWMLRRLSIL